MLKPRFYQQDAHDAAMDWMKKNDAPCLLSLPTGSGKSIIVAMLAETLHKISGGKRVLCLCPSKELTQQNFDKYISIGGKASIYSASISKSMRHPVIFATEQSFLKIAEKFAHEFCAIVQDECHKQAGTFLEIVRIFREANHNMRIVGLSATPYIMNKGYVFELTEKNQIVSDAIDPFFKKQVYSISAEKLINAISVKKTPALEKFIYGLGIRHVGVQTAIDLVNKFESVEHIQNATLDELLSIDGVGEVVAESVLAWFADPDNEKLLIKYGG